MMKLSFLFIVCGTSLLLGSSAHSQTADAVMAWTSADLLTTSESVLFHDSEKALFVSCINGKPLEKNGTGFISKLSLSGEIIVLKWATGLNAPKGMGIYGESLFVTDIDRVVKLSLHSGKVEAEYSFPGSVFLNDISVSEDGTVFISDFSTNKIHFIKNDKAGLWLESDQLNGTNGLLCEKERLLVGTNNGIFAISYTDKKLDHLVKDTGGIDGLKSDGRGNYIISDWAGKIQLVSEHAEPVVLLNTTESGINAADFEFIVEMDLLLVPTFFDNRVVAYDLIYHE